MRILKKILKWAGIVIGGIIGLNKIKKIYKLLIIFASLGIIIFLLVAVSPYRFCKGGPAEIVNNNPDILTFGAFKGINLHNIAKFNSRRVISLGPVGYSGHDYIRFESTDPKNMLMEWQEVDGSLWPKISHYQTDYFWEYHDKCIPNWWPKKERLKLVTVREKELPGEIYRIVVWFDEKEKYFYVYYGWGH